MSPLPQARTLMPVGTRGRLARADPFSPFDTGLGGPAQDEEMCSAHMATPGVIP